MSTEKKSIFDLVENFRGQNWESPLGDWLAESEKKQEEEKQRTQEISDNRNSNSTMVKSNERVKDLEYSRDSIKNLVWKIGTTLSNKFFLLHDNKGNVIKYTEEDEKYEKNLKGNNIQLPLGTKVIVISNAEIKGNLFKRVLLFWKGKYREGYIPYSAFDQQYLDSNEDILEIFINDAERILYEIEIRNEANYSTILRDAYTYVKGKIQLLKNNNSTYTGMLSHAIDSYYSNETIAYKYNHVDAIKKVINFLNPCFSNHLLSNKVIILPISQEWFELYSKVDDNLKNLIKVLKEKNIYTDLDGEVGSVIFHFNSKEQPEPDNSHLEVVVPYLLDLSKIVNNNQKLKNTPEGKWITNYDNINNLNAIKSDKEKGRLILLGKDIWDKKEFGINYAEEVGINNCFGSLYAIQIHTVLIHEFDQGGLDYIDGDTHINREESMEVWNDYLKGNTNGFDEKSILGTLKDVNYYKTDALYQLHACHGLMFLALFFKNYMS